MTFDDWCAAHGGYLNDSDDAARAAKLMARRAWDAAVAADAAWLAVQRNETPATGAEFAAALLALRAEPVQQGGWHDAAQWLRDNYQDHQTIAGLCDSMVAAAPVQRKPLTEDEIEALFEGVDSEDKGRFAIVREFARAIEAAHGIKGGGNG